MMFVAMTGSEEMGNRVINILEFFEFIWLTKEIFSCSSIKSGSLEVSNVLEVEL